MPEKLVGAFEVAVFLNLATSTVKRMAEKGTLPGAIWLGRTLRFDMSKVRLFIEAGGANRPKASKVKAPSFKGGRLPMIDSTTERTGNEFDHRNMNGRNVIASHPYAPEMRLLITE